MKFAKEALFCALIFNINSLAQETLTGVQREMARVEKEILREKELHNQEKQKAAEFEKQAEEKLKAMQTQIQSMESGLADSKSRIDQLKNQKNSVKGQIRRYESKRTEAVKFLSAKIDEWVAWYQRDFPHQKEKKIAELADLKKELSDEVIGPEEGMNRLFSILQTSLEAGYEAEIYSGSYLTSSGKAVEGKYLRLGTAAFVFSSIDGKLCAYIARSDSGFQWVDESLLPKQVEQIKSAIAVAEGKSPPELSPLPFVLLGNLK